MQSVNCKKIHSGRLQTIAAYKASTEQLITERMIEKLNNFMTDNVPDNCYPHIRLLSTHPHFFVQILSAFYPVATSADPHIRLLPIVNVLQQTQSEWILTIKFNL